MARKIGTNEPKDIRSTQRKRARKVLEREVSLGNREFKCECKENCKKHEGKVPCGWIPTGPLTRSMNLDANHINKNLMDIDPANLEWLCRSCHKNADKVTAKGVSKIDDEFGYKAMLGLD